MRALIGVLVATFGIACGDSSAPDEPVGCMSDSDCVADPAFGPDHLCVNDACVPGNCRSESDCTDGQICDDDTRLCRACVDMTEDDRCGDGAACVDGVCTAGACNVDDQCADPDLCLDHRCGCSTDATCGSGLCRDAEAGGEVTLVCQPCIDPVDDGACQTAHGPGNLCLAGDCLPGNCRVDGECGQGEICCSNSCTGSDCCGIDDDVHCAVIPGFVCNDGGSCVCPDRPPGQVSVSIDGSDVTGNGSTTCPVRSVTRALTVAAADPSATVTITVGVGTYNAANGETFPLTVSRTGIVLAGAGLAQSTIANASANTLLRTDQAVQISGFRFMSTGAAGAIVDVRAGGQIQSVDIVGSGTTAACVVGNNGAALELGPAATIRSCVNGATINSGAVLTISSEVRQNNVGVVVAAGGTVRVVGGAIRLNGGAGLQLSDSAVANATSQLDGAVVEDNGGDGVTITLNSRLTIRNSMITGNGGNGVRAIGASVQLDLGTGAQPGNNTLNRTTDRNIGVGVCNQTGRTLDAVNDVWASCPPSTNGACTGGNDINSDINAANCASL